MIFTVIAIISVFTLIVFFYKKHKILFIDENRSFFKSNVKIKLPDGSKQKLFDESFKILETVDSKYNSYSTSSHIYNINMNAGFYTDVDKTTIFLLEKIKEYSDILEGEYDVTIMPLLKLWGFYNNDNTLPTKEEINLLKKSVNYKNIEILRKENKVKIDKSQEIITGSFIKSFAADEVVKYLSSNKISDALINISSSTIIGLNKRKKYWELIIEDPDDETKDLFLIKLSNEALSISGNSNNFVTINGERYGHIISPESGYPTKNKLTAVISSTAFRSDVFSTGLYNFSGGDFIKKINEIEGLEGILMNEKREIFYSKNFKKFILEKYI